MGLFRKHPPITEPELTPALTKRLDELSDRQDRFERIVKDLRLEWDEMYDKLRLLYARASKRLKDAANAEEDAPQSRQDAPRSTIPRAVAYDRPYLNAGDGRKGNY